MSNWSRRAVVKKMIAATGAAIIIGRPAYAAGKEHVVEIQDFEFVPDNLIVRAGDTITWVNQDLAPHTATAVDGSWDTGELTKGQSATLQVSKDMVLDYYCVFHPHMEASLSFAK